MEIEDKLADEQAGKMGSIWVGVNRVTSKKLDQPKTVYPGPYKPLTTLKFPSAIVKDRNIGHAMVFVICARFCRDMGNANDMIAWALALLPPPH